ncbi:hypothetical protein [Thalassiella azotivora]
MQEQEPEEGRTTKRVDRVLGLVKWVALAVVLVQALLVWTGVLDLREAVGLALALEALLALAAVTLAVRGGVGYRRARAQGSTREEAFLEALRPVVPAFLLAVVRHEYGVFGAIGQRLRGRVDVAPEATAVPYGRDVTPFLALFAGLSVVELVVVHLLVPWEWLRVLLLVLGAYGLVWIIGLLCAIHVRPHQVDRSTLLLRFAHVAQVAVPADAVVKAAAQLSSGHRRTVDVEGGHLALAVGGSTNVRVQLRPGTRVTTGRGEVHHVDSVSFTADEAPAAVRAIERAAAQGSQ